MIMYEPTQHAKPIRLLYSPVGAPPSTVEYAYYALVFYGIMGSALGMSIALLGAGGLAVLAAVCIWRLGLQAWRVYTPIMLPIACAVSFVAVQIAIHGESLMDQQYLRPFVPWMLSLIIVYSLSLRQGFLHRFVLVAFVIGLSTVPFLDFAYFGSQGRVGLERGIGGANPNDLAGWWGFLFVYFTVVGLETKRGAVRMASWLVAVGCLFIVGLTVSRGPLFASAIAIIVASRRLLKRGFLPALLLMILTWLIYASGLFEQTTVLYTERGLEETGRLAVWPIAIERFLGSPLAGVGVSDVDANYPVPIPPHNSFLFIALTSGIVPLVFFVAYWWRAALGTVRAYAERSADASFRIPLLIYAFLIALILDGAFMQPWVIVTLSTAIATGASRRVHRIVVRRIRRGETGRQSGRGDEVSNGAASYQLYGRPKNL